MLRGVGISPFSTLVRSLPCFAFSNRGWCPSTSSPVSLHDLSNSAPSPHGAVLRAREQRSDVDTTSHRRSSLRQVQRRARGEEGERKRSALPPDVEVKGDVSFDLQFVVPRWLKYTVVCAVVVSQQLTVQEPARKGDQV